MVTCWHCKAETAPAHYERVVYNRTALHGEWQGWRMCGAFLIGPNRERFTVGELVGLASEKKRVRVRSGAGPLKNAGPDAEQRFLRCAG